jgi:hypothetical protein
MEGKLQRFVSILLDAAGKIVGAMAIDVVSGTSEEEPSSLDLEEADLRDYLFVGESVCVVGLVIADEIVDVCSVRLLEQPSSRSADCATKLGLSVGHTGSRHG